MPPAAPAQSVENLVEGRLQVRGIDRVEHGADVVVGRDCRHAAQAVAVRWLAPLLQPALVRQERLRYEEQRKGRQADAGRAVGYLAAPFIEKSSTPTARRPKGSQASSWRVSTTP